MAFRPRLKICAVTTAADARLVSESGADYCGVLVNVGFSERSLSLEQAREVAAACSIPVVALVCDAGAAAVEEIDRRIAPYAVQLLGRESPDYVRALRPRLRCRIWKALHHPPAPGQARPEEYVEAGVDAFVMDTCDASEGFLRLGGTGKTGDWDRAAELVRGCGIPVFLAGGIGAENLAGALAKVRPYGLDLCSSVESCKGKKDPEKVRRLVEAFRTAVAAIEERER